MYEIKESAREIEGIDVTTYTRDVYGPNILRVEAGTNGYKGGNSSHGCRTYFRITDQGGTDIRVNALEDDCGEGFEVVLGGDDELETVIRALKFITKVLEDQANGVCD